MLIQRHYRIWLMNALLAGLALFFSAKALTIPSAVKASDHTAMPKAADAAPMQVLPVKRPLPGRSAFNEIIEENLFSKERAEIMPFRSAGHVGTSPPAQEVSGLILYGIVIEGTEKRALVANLGDKQGKASVWVRAGDRLGRYIVKDIQPDKLFISGGDTTYTLRMSEGTRQRKPSVVRRKPMPSNRALQNKPGAPLRGPAEGRKARKRFAPAR